MFYLCTCFIEAQLIYNAVLASRVQQSESLLYTQTHVFFFRFFPLTDYHEIWQIVPCAAQYNLVV